VRGDFALAASRAHSAHSLNPLSAAPVTQQAAAEEGLRNLVQAYALYIRAVDLEPENPDTWFDLGEFQLLTIHDARGAFDSLNRSYTLDPLGPAGQPGGPLDQARCRAFHRLCNRVRGGA
jgi:Flp pilus assembly protein TadD